MSNNLIESVAVFMRASGFEITERNTRLAALYTGLQLEELAEKMHAIGVVGLADYLHSASENFKTGIYDHVFACLSPDQDEHLLDADIDLAWVSLGGSFALGADVAGAANEVAHANLAKRGKDGMMMKNEQGKVVKPDGWKPPEMAQFTHANHRKNKRERWVEGEADQLHRELIAERRRSASFQTIAEDGKRLIEYLERKIAALESK
jgi:predicted HAD superfamily Cof-like phosphohydrolase